MRIARNVKAISPVVPILHCKKIRKMIDEQGTPIALTPRSPNSDLSALDSIVPELIRPGVNGDRKCNFPVLKQDCKLGHVIDGLLNSALNAHVAITGQVLGNSPHGSDDIVARICDLAAPNNTVIKIAR